jgi:two-component system, NtrC family, response regulator
MADQGTIVFNEVEKLPTKGQAIVLRFLQNNTIECLGSNKLTSIDARIIATSHSELKTAVKEGIFRNDLYFHISSVKLSIPPLRERRGDVTALADFFLLKYAIKRHKKITGFTPAALEALWCHDWLGNVTELENRIKGAVVRAMGGKISHEDLGTDIPKDKKYTGLNLKTARDNLERDLILRALSRHGNNITRACEALGISRPTLYDLMEKLRIPKQK